jgi:signal transduction histidine kinase
VRVEPVFGLGGQQAPIDAARMSRVIINLISNASEAMVGKGDDPAKFATATPLIIVESRLTPRGVEIAVTDNGPGITPENLKRIFEPLFTTKSFGTGLGLPAVEKILEQHGGGLEVKSTPGEGACFTAWFPAEQKQQEAA